jgi:hypothetical protein
MRGRSSCGLSTTIGTEIGRGKVAASAIVRLKEKPANPQLVGIACKAVPADWKPLTVLGKDGKPSRSVQNAIVKFTTQEFR